MEFKGRQVLDHEGFGFLVPSSQPQPLLGCIYDTCTFPQGNRTLLTVMTGGAWYQDMVGDRSAQEVEAEMVEEVRRILKISSQPVRSHSSLLHQCILSTRWVTPPGWSRPGRSSRTAASSWRWPAAAMMGS